MSIAMPDERNFSTGELLRVLDGSINLVDCRPPDAYNGWRIRNEVRGGHIPGARNLPCSWIGGDELRQALSAKDLDPWIVTAVYGYDEEDAGSMVEALSEAGFREVRSYHHFIEEWLVDPELPLARLPGFRKLVHADWLQELIRGGRPGEYDNDACVICHAHYRNPEDYSMGHIPGAVALDTLSLEEPEGWNRRSPGELEESLSALGIDADTTVILYGRYGSPDSSDPFPGSNAGQIAAMRCAVIMMYAGVKDVRVLNGGLMSWQGKGYEIDSSPVMPVRSDRFGADIPGRPELMVDLPGARDVLASDDADLVSVRSWKEFIGEVSGYNYFDRAGRISGAVFGDCGSDAYHMENFRNPDHTMREFGEIERNWLSAGLSPDRRTSFYCGTGWRASEAFFCTLLLGWKNISVYDGGWMEWSGDPSNPVATGVPPEGGGRNRRQD